MKAPHFAWLAAIVAHIAGWLTPVVRDYVGWQAFRVALSPLWPFEGFRIQPGPLLWLSVASALTNVVFVVVAVVLVTQPARRAKVALWAAAAATLLNLHWPISMGAERDELRAGYFVWIGSFALLTLAAFFVVVRRRR
jgi:hypothetical protein